MSVQSSEQRPPRPTTFRRPSNEPYRSPGWLKAVVATAIAIVFLVPVAPWNGNVVFLAVPVAAGAWALAHQQHRRRRRDSEGASEAHNRAVFEAHLAETKRWEASRPMTRVATASRPLQAVEEVAAAANVMTFFGVVTDTREIVGGTDQQSAVVVGPTGVGKTTAILDPSVLIAPGAALVMTSKPHDAVTTMKSRMARGRVWLYDPTNTIAEDLLPAGVHRIQWDPFFDCQRYDRARLVATHLVESSSAINSPDGTSKYFASLVKNLLTGLVFVVANHEAFSVGDLYDWIEDHDLDVARAVAYAMATNTTHPHQREAVRVLKKLDALEHHEAKMRDSIFTTALVALDAYDFTAVRSFAGQHNFSIDDFIASTDTVYVCAPAEYQSAVAPVLTLFVEEVYRLRADATTEARKHGRTTVPLLAAFDEAAHIATLPQMPRFLAEGRGNGFITLMLLQTLGQARELWGKKGETLFDEAAVRVAFGGISDPDTLQRLSVMAGDWDRPYVSTSESWSTSTNEGTSDSRSWSPFPSPSHGTSSGTSASFTTGTSSSVHKERRISDGDISSLPRGHALVLGGGGPARPVELVNSHHGPWQKVIAAAEAHAVTYAPVAELSSPVLAHPLGDPLDLLTRYAAHLEAEA